MLTTEKTEGKLVYIMYNTADNIEIECTKRYLPEWLGRGFKIREIRVRDNK